ncbi:hypothetical protein DP113_12100 [Brasilonema octagenarum UFV-E1]|uniref:Uncharacterized protein n=2 Tax=Brasilonema TaxID=383614 RepID=A0A856MBB6_9CYAN|nr:MULTISPECIES: hypothetical protein [Brasilonema]NMF62972.1 hypothetical protein [Brasilonema octagenarum UFV-OR1]QDL08545.1 hypothetical protein DP114_12165 [Brasilonema sennae CENA114]QDL14900.1 hypothetical protein DP113_12100 [Brasilonema octagenarum UFV-E1]
MLNFHELQPVVNDKYSFVGIQKRDSQIQLCLPRGFDPAVFDTYNSKCYIFFLLYKILRQFKDICNFKGYLQSTADRDGVVRGDGSTQKISLPDAVNEGNMLYSKLDNIGAILAAYDELKILSLAYRLGITEKIDYSQIHRFLHRAVYQNNGGAYIDAMTLPRQQVKYQSTDIVAMYCYILWEIKQKLDEEIPPELQVLAEDFKHRYIGAEYSLFHEEYCTQTIDILKDVLELIKRYTPLKDDDFWQFHDAIELFLYGELSQQDEGEIWGIKNFHSVWESMCITYLAKNLAPEYILHLDGRYIADDVLALVNSKPKILDLTDTFIINGKQLMPDAVVYYFGKYFIQNNIERFNQYFTLYRKDWNDYSYETLFNCYISGEVEYERRIRICYKNQSPEAGHTFVELEKIYSVVGKKLLINSQLPNNFYSFWHIDVDELNPSELDLMFQVNHVFCVALKNGILTPATFKDFLETDLGVEVDYYNVFNNSLFRYYVRERYDKSIDDLVSTFADFIQKVSCGFQIVDIKYLEPEAFSISNNFRELKERSIRKQFVYEYLLQQRIESNGKYKDLEIRSDFWFPSSWSDSNVLKETINNSFFGYIDFNDVNFAAIADSYLR